MINSSNFLLTFQTPGGPIPWGGSNLNHRGHEMVETNPEKNNKIVHLSSFSFLHSL